MRTRKVILEDELSENFIKQIDEQDGLLRNWIYDAMTQYAIEYHKYKSELDKEPETSDKALPINDVIVCAHEWKADTFDHFGEPLTEYCMNCDEQREYKL